MTPLIQAVKEILPGPARKAAAAVWHGGRAASFGLFAFLRARLILGAYRRHYARARAAYSRRNGAPAHKDLLPSLGVRVILPGGQDRFSELPPDFTARAERVAHDVRSRFELAGNCAFVPPLPGDIASRTTRTADIAELGNGDVITIQLRDPLAVQGLEDLADPLVDLAEREVFGSCVQVDKVYIYRSPPSHRKPFASWLWHYDNHPREIVKVMVYLCDVDEGTAPFEYIRHSATGRPLYGRRIAPLFGDSRVPDDAIHGYLDRGFESQRVCGPAGTVLVFDHNVVHRANVASARARDVVVFQLRPATGRLIPRISPAHTGSFQHAPFNPIPSRLSPRTKRLRHYS